MSEFKPAFKPYSLETAIFDDCGEDCIVIDVSGGQHAPATPSLQRIVEKVDSYLQGADMPEVPAKKLYITGHWIAAPLRMESEGEPEAVEIKVSVSSSPLSIAHAQVCHPGEYELILDQQECAQKTAEWKEATDKIGALLEQMGNLEELT